MASEAELRPRSAASVFRAIQLYYPDEYRALTETLSRHAAAQPGDGASLDALRRRLLVSLYRRRADDLARAPGPLLNDINARQLALIRLLAPDDEKLCAEFATTLFIGRFDLSAFYQDKASDLSVAILEAAKAGESRPPDPKRSALGEDDASLWYEQLLLVEPSSDIQAAIAADGDEAIGSPELQCRIGAGTYGAIARLAPEPAANVAAYFLAQTLAEPGPD